MQPLTDYINKEYREGQHDNAGAIHPSSLNDCDRKVVYQYLGLEKDIKEHSQFLKRIFFHGNRIEKWMNAALNDKGILIARKVSICAEVNGVLVEGEIDHIVTWRDGWRIGDTKSVSDFALKRYGFELPYRHHALQVGAYEWMLEEFCKLPFDTICSEVARMKKKKGDRDGRVGCPYPTLYDEKYFGPAYPPILFYVGRGNLEEMPTEVGTEARGWAYKKLQVIAGHINAETIPDRPFSSPNEHRYLCARCTRKGGYKRKNKTGRAAYKAGNEPFYVPSCEWFGRCWEILPQEWSFWDEVTG